MAAFCRQEFTFVFRKMLQGPDGEYAADMEMTCPYTYQTNSASFPPRTMPTTGDGGIIGTVSGDDGKIYNKYASYTTLGSGATNPVRYNKGDLPTFVATPSGYNEVTRGPVLHVSSVAGTEKYQVHATVTWFEDYSAYIDVFFDRDTCAVKMYAIGGEKASDGGWRFDRTSTRRLVKSETVVRGATCELPDAATMEEYVGADFELYMDDRGRFWFEGAPDDAPDDTMQSSYLKRMVSSPVLVTKDVNLYCAYFISDDSKLVKFGTLKNMFGVYKEKSDAALEERLTNLPPGGADMEAAMDARLAEYTAERDQAVSEAVGTAKTEVLAEVPKPFDFVTNPDQEDGGYLTAKSINADKIDWNIPAADRVPVSLIRPTSTSTRTSGMLCLQRSDIESAMASTIEAAKAEVLDAVRQSVEGVVLYENTEHDHGATYTTFKGDLFEKYERIEVTARAHRDIASNAQSVTAVSVFTKAEYAMGTGTAARNITHAASYVWDTSNFDEFLLGFIQVYTYLGANAQTDVIADDNIRNFRVAADGTNATATVKKAGEYWVHIERIVGYTKLPEAV